MIVDAIGERPRCLSHVLLMAFPAGNQINKISCFAVNTAPYFEGSLIVCTFKCTARFDVIACFASITMTNCTSQRSVDSRCFLIIFADRCRSVKSASDKMASEALSGCVRRDQPEIVEFRVGADGLLPTACQSCSDVAVWNDDREQASFDGSSTIQDGGRVPDVAFHLPHHAAAIIAHCQCLEENTTCHVVVRFRRRKAFESQKLRLEHAATRMTWMK